MQEEANSASSFGLDSASLHAYSHASISLCVPQLPSSHVPQSPSSFGLDLASPHMPQPASNSICLIVPHVASNRFGLKHYLPYWASFGLKRHTGSDFVIWHLPANQRPLAIVAQEEAKVKRPIDSREQAKVKRPIEAREQAKMKRSIANVIDL